MNYTAIKNQIKNIHQRDIISCLILLIFIIIAVIFLVSGKGVQRPIEMPIDEFKAAISTQIELEDEDLHSEHKGLMYEKKLKRERALAIAKKKREEEERKRQEEERRRILAEKKQIAKKVRRAKSLEFIPSSDSEENNGSGENETAKSIENSEEYKEIQGSFKWNGSVINRSNGTVTGPSGKETYYNLPMGGVVSIMRGMGNRDKYWVRSDGCKMLGYYIMVAANFSRHPRGSIVKCSRGYAIVCDTGTFAASNPNQLDIAVNW